jgi:hypothetical protein
MMQLGEYYLLEFSKIAEREVTGALLAADLELIAGETAVLARRQKARLAEN